MVCTYSLTLEILQTGKEPADDVIRRLAEDNNHRHILDPEFRYGHEKISDAAVGDDTDPKVCTVLSVVF